MLASKFLELAKSKGACRLGLEWLEKWIVLHPKSSISGFFKSQINCDRTHHCYLMWVWFRIINSLELFESSDIELDHFYAKNLMLFGHRHTISVPTNKLAFALAKEFRGVR